MELLIFHLNLWPLKCNVGVVKSKLLSLSLLLFSHTLNMDKNSIYHMPLLWELNVLIYIKHFD